MRTYEVVARVGAEAPAWSLVNDPAAWRDFVSELVDRHHRIVAPGAVADQCSCGRPFMLCPIAPLTDAMVEHGPRAGEVGRE